MAELSRGRVSACLLSWRRPKNVEAIVRRLHQLAFIDEILVWNNNPACRLQLEGAKVQVIESETNVMCAGRFLCAAQARNEVIYTQDDDALVYNVSQLHQAFLRDPTRITHGLSDWHYTRRQDYLFGDSQMAFLGWGSLFKKDWLADLDLLPPDVRSSEL